MSLGLAFGATPSSRLSVSPRLPAPALPGSRRCRGAAAVRDQRGPASPAAARALSARPALLGHLGDGSGIAPGWIVPAVGCGGLAGPAELIPIVSEPLSIVIPDHKEPGGAGSGAATGRAPSISPQPLPFLIRPWPRLKMSVAPGSGEGSFRVLYIALIYMSLEINLASTLPRHPPPPPPPLRPPSPSGLGLHLCFPLAPGRVPVLEAPHGSSRSCRGAGEPGPRGALSPGTVAAAAWAGRVTAAGMGGTLPGGLLWAQGAHPGSAARGSRLLIAGLGRARGWKGTYVMSMDWFSRSGREGAGIRAALPTSPLSQEPRLLRLGSPRAGLTAQHVIVGVVGDGVDVRRCLRASLALVGCHHGRRVHGQPLVGVDGNTEEPRVGLQGKMGG